MSEREEQLTRDAVNRAVNGESFSNYAAIFEGFAALGIGSDDIRPRENVFTYRVWRAKGRQVEKGQHGVKIVTFIDVEKEGKKTKMPRSVTVFHVSQTNEAQEAN